VRRALLVLAVLLASVPRVRGQGGGGETLTLDQALSLALAGNRPIAAAKLDVEKAEQDVTLLKTRRRPLFDVRVLEGGFLMPMEFFFKTGLFGTFPSTGPVPMQDTPVASPRGLNTIALFTASQPLTQLHRIGIGTQLYSLGRTLAEEKVREQQQSLVADVKRLYYGILTAQSGLRAVDEAITLFKELDRVMTDYVERQVVLPADRLSVQTQLAKVGQQRLTVLNTEATLKEQLNLLMGRDVETAVNLSPVPDATIFEVDLAAAQKRAAERRPALRQADLNVKRAETDLRLKKAEAIPDLSLFFAYTRLINIEILPKSIMALGVTLDWEPFDWGRRKIETATRERTVQQATLAAREAAARVQVDVNARFRKVAEARALLQVTELARRTAQEKLRVATDRYETDAALVKDVLEAQAGLAEATQKHEEALLALWTARAEFEQAIGES